MYQTLQEKHTIPIPYQKMAGCTMLAACHTAPASCQKHDGEKTGVHERKESIEGCSISIANFALSVYKTPHFAPPAIDQTSGFPGPLWGVEKPQNMTTLNPLFLYQKPFPHPNSAETPLSSPPPLPLWDTDACARPALFSTKQKCKAKVKEESSSVTCHRRLSLQ